MIDCGRLCLGYDNTIAVECAGGRFIPDKAFVRDEALFMYRMYITDVALCNIVIWKIASDI